jgi:hypothetical protein
MDTGFDMAYRVAGNNRREKCNFSVCTSVAKPCRNNRLSIVRNYVAQALGWILLTLTPAFAAAEPGGESYESVANMLGSMQRYKMPSTLRQRNSSDEVYLWGVAEHSADDFTRMTGWRISKSLHVGYQQGLESGLSLLWQGDRDQMSFSSDGIRFTRRF